MDEHFFLATELLMKQAKEVRLDNQPNIQKLVMGAAASGDIETLEHVSRIFQIEKLGRIDNPAPFYKPTPEELYSEPKDEGILVGRVKNTHPSIPFFIFLAWVMSHILIVGRTGCGKTTLFFWILSGLLSLNIPVIIFDRKNDFRHFLRINNNLLVIRVRQDFKFNPFAVPEGVDPLVWAEVVVDIICREFKILEGGRAILLITIIELYKRFGMLSGSRNFPGLFDVIEALKSTNIPRNSRRWQSIETLLGRLETLWAAHEKMFDCSIGFSLDEIFERPCVVFETNGLSDDMTSVFINVILQHPYQQRLARQERGLGLRNAIFLEEARHILNPFINSNIGYSSIENILCEGRELGLGVIAAAQSINLNPAIHINSFVKICYSLGKGDEVKKIQTTFQLDDDQTSYLTRLNIGEAIVKIPSFKNPFCLEIPRFPLG